MAVMPRRESGLGMCRSPSVLPLAGLAASGCFRLSVLAVVLGVVRVPPLLLLLSSLPPPQPASHVTSGAPSSAIDTRREYWF
jgi:hypothetical protein